MRSMNRTLALGLTLAALALTGCKSNEECRDCDNANTGAPAATMGAASNTTCPISGEPVSADIKTVSFNGKEIGFCCNGCVAKFAALSDADKAAKLGTN